jgi:hypothetical protein
MKPKSSESAVDRLIALASDAKPAVSRSGNGQGNANTDLEAVPVFGDPALELEHNPMWKALLQFRAVLPYVSRLLEMSHPEPSGGASAELKHSVAELANTQRDLRIAVQDQLVQMKHIEEEMTRAREAAERNAAENIEMVEDVRLVHATVKKAAFTLGGLLIVLIGLVIWLLVRMHVFVH